MHAVLKRGCAPRAVHGALGGGAVVASEINHQRIVEGVLLHQIVDHPLHLSIGMGHEASEHFHQPGSHWLVAVWIFRPTRHLLRTLGQRRAFRNHSHGQLTLVYLLAQCIPALVELTLKLVDPFWGYMMRGVHGSRGKVAKERFIRCRHLLLGDPLDGFFGEVFGEVIVVTAKVRFYWCGLIVDRWLPVGGLSPNDAVEALEAHACWPTVKGPCGVLLPSWS